MPTEVHRFDANRRRDFFELHSASNGAGWCRCVAWWVPTWEGWGERTTEQNRRLRERLCDTGGFDGYLAYDDGEPVGWCQVGPRDRLHSLVRQYGLDHDAEVWAITCFLVAPSHRRRGVARTLLARVLDDLPTRGVGRVEAFPRRATDDPWTGPEGLFLAAGFELARDDPERPVLSLSLR